MSRLAQKNGDDYPDAARKHLLDAQALLASQRFDGAAYLSGYVVECALKSLILLQGKTPPRSHSIEGLLKEVENHLAVVAGARAARYFGRTMQRLAAAAIMNWTPKMRYRAPAMTYCNAQAWLQEACHVFRKTIQQMQLDGVI